jgi:predicted metalloprotease
MTLILIFLAVACGGNNNDDSAQETRPAEETDEPEEPTPDDGPTPEETVEATELNCENPADETERTACELLDDVDTAVFVVDDFWAVHWGEFFTGTYVSPEVYGGYLGSDNPTCGGIYADGSGNAYYCPVDDYLAWDWDLLASQFLDEAIGDSFVYVVIAHEWAHGIQERLDVSLHTVDGELQADCLAAAALTGAAADGTLQFEPGDRGEIFQSFARLADEVEWGDSEDHGSADERIEAYQLGEQGVNACLPAE